MAFSTFKGSVLNIINTVFDSTNNWLAVSLGSKLAGEDQTADVLKVENRFSYATITSATTTVVKSGAGFLHRIVVTGGTTGTIVAYDATSAAGTKVFDFDT